MSKHTAKKRIWTGIGALAALVLLVCALMMIGGVSANPDVKMGDTVSITYSVGTLPGGGSVTGASVSQSTNYTVNSSDCVVLEELRPTVANGLDSETFVQDEKAYSFTGWKISSSAEKIPGKSVFQPGDTITSDVLDLYVSGEGGSYTLTLEALWGQCYFVENPFENMTYLTGGFAVDTANSGAATGAADSNSGLINTAPKASVDSVFEAIRAKGESADAYATVVMLTGDLDYFKDTGVSSHYFGYAADPAGNPVFASATFKSLGDTAFNFNFKPYGTGAIDSNTGLATGQIYGNLRYDNINFLHAENTHANWQYKVTTSGYDTTAETQYGETIGYEYALDADTDLPYYCEFTARMNQSVPKYRTHAIRNLRLATTDYAVVNGGLYAEISARPFGDVPEEHNQVWRFGRNIYVNGNVHGGNATSAVASRNGALSIFFTGGKITGSLSGAGTYNTTQGDRKIYILGQETTSEASYTLVSGALVEEEFVDTPTTYSYDSNVPTLNGAFYGAHSLSYTANALTGDINIIASNANVNGLIYGSSNRGTVTGNIVIDFYNVVSDRAAASDNVWAAGQATVTGSVSITIDGAKTKLKDVYGGNRSYGSVGKDVSVTVKNGTLTTVYCGGHTSATAIKGNVTAAIEGGTIGTVYATGNAAPVSGTVQIDVTGGNITNLYGGCSDGTYAGVPKIHLNGGKIATVYGGGNKNTTSVAGVDLTVDGATITNNLFGGGNNGSVAGDVALDIISGTITGNVYGGGNSGSVTGSTTLTITGGTIYNDSDSSGHIYGGGYAAASVVGGDTTVTMTGGSADRVYGGSRSGTVQNVLVSVSGDCTIGNLYGGGHQESAVTNGTIDVDVFGNATITIVYAGGDMCNYAGIPDLDITGGTISENVYGGCYSGTVSATDVYLSGTTIGNAVIGGGNLPEAVVAGNSNVIIENNCQIGGTIYGGGRNSMVNGNVTLTISDSTIKHVRGGGVASGVGGTITTTVTNCAVGGSLAGSGGADDSTVGGDVTFLVQNCTGIDDIYGAYNETISGNVYLTVEDTSFADTTNNRHIWGAGYADIRADGSGNGGNVYLTVQRTNAQYIFGGGLENSVVEGTAYVNITDCNGEKFCGGGHKSTAQVGAVEMNFHSGTVNRLFGGGVDGTVVGDVVLNANGGTVKTDIGGGNHTGGSIGGNVTVNLNGVKANNNVFGGSHSGGSIAGQITVNGYAGTTVKSVHGGHYGPDYAGNTDVNIYGGTYTNVYGGGYNGAVNDTHIQIWSGTIGYVYGGGREVEATAVNTNVLVDANASGAGTISIQGIRGGGNVGAVSGNVNVTVSDVADGEKKITLGIYGEGAGVLTEGNRNVIYGGGITGAVAGTANITLSDLNVGKGTQPVSLYGGGQQSTATVGNVLWALHNVQVLDTDASDETCSRFFGGGEDGAVTGSVQTIVTGDTVFDADYYGGGNYGTVGSVTNRIGGNALFQLDFFGAGYIKDADHDAAVGSAHTIFDGTDIRIMGEAYGAGFEATTGTVLLEVKNGRFGDFSPNDTNNGNIYGGAYAGAVTGTTTVLFEGEGSVETERSVYGGSRMVGSTSADTVVTLSNPNAVVNHYLFGGGISGSISGDVTVNINAGTVGYHVYGGSSTANVGVQDGDSTVTLNILGGNLKQIYGGGKGHADDGLDSPVDSIVYGDVILNIRDVADDGYAISKLTRIYGGGHSAKATVCGDITTNLENVTVTAFYGGGNSGPVEGNITNNILNLNPRTIYDGGDKPVLESGIYYHGGGCNGTVTGNISNNWTGTLEGDTVSYVYEYVGGGENSSAVVNGNITNTLTGEMGETATGSHKTSGLVIGYVYYGGCVGSTLNGNITNLITDIDMRKLYSGSSLSGTYFYGGSYNGVINGDVSTTLNGTDPQNQSQLRTIYSANAYGVVNGTSNMTVLGSVYNGGDYLVGGGRFGSTRVETTNVLIDGPGSDLGDVFGGGHVGKVIGNAGKDVAADTHVTVLNGTIDYVYGGGSSLDAAVDGNTFVQIGDPSVAPEKLVIEGDVHGGGYNGTVGGNARIVMYNGTINSEIYGAGRGEEENGGAVSGSVTIRLYGGTVGNAVYGGGYGSTANASESDIALIGAEIGSNVFGGGFRGSVYQTNVQMVGGSVGNNVYGAGTAAASQVYTANVVVIGGSIGNSIFGGGNAGSVVDNPITKALEGNTNVLVEGDTSFSLTIDDVVYHPVNTTLNGLYGGGYTGTVENNTGVTLHDMSGSNKALCNVQVGTGTGTTRAIFGGGHQGPVNGSTYVLLDNCYVGKTLGGSSVYIFGGGRNTKATVGNAHTVFRNMTYSSNAGRTFGGGYYGAVLNDCSFTLEGATNHNGTLFGGGEYAPVGGTATTSILDTSHLEECLYAGGRYAAATAGNTHVIIDASKTPVSGKYTLEHTLFGGGILAEVKGNTLVEFKNGSVNYSAFAGGDIAHVGGTSTIKVSGDSYLNTNLYGGGRGRTRQANVGNTVVEVTGNAYIKGGVYGGGEGFKTLVHGTTDVTIDMDHTVTVTEQLADLSSPTSGKTGVTIDVAAGTAGTIGGSVYGGGNRGAVGEGSVIVGTNDAEITTPGKTKVTVKGGHIVGSVFGGGRGEPTAEETYQISMGAVFGSTETNIYGGSIGGKAGVGGVYGGGEKSRVYGAEGTKVAIVNIDATQMDADIAIHGSVFGGGDRGEGKTMNTSIPTTVGDVEVNIIGETTAEARNQATQIYIKDGGVFGDGNLCKTEGTRVINIQDFGTGVEPRADATTLKTLHSIQRAGTVNLINSDVVLIGLEDTLDSGDYETYSISRVDALYLKEGSTVKLDSIVKYLGALHSDYQAERTFIDKGYNNVNNQYTGHGGQVGNVEKLTDEEIATYITNDVTLANNHTDYNTVCIANGRYLTIADEKGVYGPVTGLYTLELLNAVPGEGGGFVYGDITTSTGDFICTTPYSALARSADGYMDVIDNVGKLVDEPKYSYYYWYISGDQVNYDLSVDGYLGINKLDYADSTAFAYAQNAIDGAPQPLHYVLESVAVNDVLTNLLNTYDLETSASAIASTNEKAIAVEFKLAGQSLGFLTKTNGGQWALLNGGNAVTGLQGVQVEENGQIEANSLLYDLVDGTNNLLEVVLYRSQAADDWTEGMGVTMTMKLFQETAGETYQPVENGAHTHVINATMALRRVVPTQAVYTENRRNYVGVAGLTDIRINEHSSFTAEIQTDYIPSAFPAEGSTFVTSLNISSLPVGTKITLADLTGDTPTFYYYIKTVAQNAVNLSEFMQMGTEIRIADLPEAPAFVEAYEGQSSEIVNERLLFVFDFEQVDAGFWTSFSPADPHTGTITLNHLYDGHEIMVYNNADGSASVAETMSYGVYPTVEGLESFTIDFSANSADGDDAGADDATDATFPVKGASQFEVDLTESTVAADTRYYEGEFALKLQMYLDDDLTTPVPMPDGIVFECNGKQFYPDYSNEFAVVGVNGYGTHTVTMNTDLFGIEGVSGKVTLKAEVYSAAEATYHNSINTTRTAQGYFLLGDAYDHHLLIHSENRATNLLLDRGETLSFTLTTLVTNETDPSSEELPEEDAIVSVEAYRKVEGAYKEPVDLGKLFTEGHLALAQTDGEAVANDWLVHNTAEAGTYRLVFTFANRVEYLYFVIN